MYKDLLLFIESTVKVGGSVVGAVRRFKHLADKMTIRTNAPIEEVLRMLEESYTDEELTSEDSTDQYSIYYNVQSYVINNINIKEIC
jgi:hypothetical protein